MYIQLWSLKVKVSLIFSGTVGFPPCREGRYKQSRAAGDTLKENIANATRSVKRASSYGPERYKV